jgi:hypothetical protein
MLEPQPLLRRAVEGPQRAAQGVDRDDLVPLGRGETQGEPEAPGAVRPVLGHPEQALGAERSRGQLPGAPDLAGRLRLRTPAADRGAPREEEVGDGDCGDQEGRPGTESDGTVQVVWITWCGSRGADQSSCSSPIILCVYEYCVEELLCTFLAKNEASSCPNMRVEAGWVIVHVKLHFLGFWGFRALKSLLLLSRLACSPFGVQKAIMPHCSVCYCPNMCLWVSSRKGGRR